MINITLFKNQFSKKGKALEISWSELTAKLSTPGGNEKAGPAWMPACTEIGQRKKGFIKAIDVLVLDVEANKKLAKEPPSVDIMLAKLKEASLTSYLHTTYSHTDKHPRYRLVFQLNRPLKPDELRPVGVAVAESLDIVESFDLGALEPARLYYLPRCPEERSSLFRSETVEGAPLQIDIIVNASVNSSAKDSTVVHLAAQPGFSLPANIPEGSRNDTLIRYAGHLRGKSFVQSDIESILLTTNLERCDPPLDESEMSQIVRQYANQAVQLPEDGKHEQDIANGKLFADKYRGQLLFVHDTSDWFRFDPGLGWRRAPPKSEETAAKQVVRVLREKAADAYVKDPGSSRAKELMKRVKRVSQLTHLRAMIEMAKSEPGMSEQLSSFDTNNFVLGVRNGIMNLKTRTLVPFTPEVLVSKRANVEYDPAATSPRFKQYLKEVVPDDAHRAFLQRWCGYCLTGSVSEQKMLFLHGFGCNGKTVLVELLAYILGDYAKKIQSEMLMKHYRNPQAASPDIVGLKASRLVYCSETTEGRRIDSARFKEITGGDTLVGRALYGKSDTEFRPTHKLMMVGNYQPLIRDNSHGFWRRMIMFPFQETIPEESIDKDLLEKLKTEAPAILNWMLDGLDEWREDQLNIPQKLLKATESYRGDQDIFGKWFDEQCEPGKSDTRARLYKAYKTWCHTNGYQSYTSNRFSRQLTQKGFPAESDNRTVIGIKLAISAQEENTTALS